MRIVIFGQAPFGAKTVETLADRGEEVVAVFTVPDRGPKPEPTKEAAQAKGIPVHQPASVKDPEVQKTLAGYEPDLGILAFWTEITPESVLFTPRLGSICYHPSILPRHRGASAINWAVIMGDTKTGLTIFWTDGGIDTGPILLQKEIDVSSDDTTGSLYFNHLFPLGVEAIAEAVDLIKAGDPPRIEQDDSRATYEPPCDDRVAAVDFSRPVEEVYNLIRGCDPQPGAYTFFRDEKIRLYGAKMEEGDFGAPGTVVAAGDTLDVAVQGGVIRASKVRFSGGKVKVGEFVEQTGIAEGVKLGG